MPPPESDMREVLNYVRALEYGLQRLNKLPISIRLIREVHERLMKDVRGRHTTPGEFRTRQNWIGAPGCTLNEATFVPPPVEEMKAALGALEKYLHEDDQTPPLARLAFIHYQFEAIHPFIDGNGRIGRLLLSLLLVNWNLLPLPLLYLSAYFEHHRQQYYDLLMAVSQREAWREWMVYFLRGVAEQAQDAVGRAKQLQDLQVEWRRVLQKERSSSLMFSALDVLFEQPYLPPTFLAQRLKITHQTAMKILNRLEALQIVQEMTARKRNRLYCAVKIIQIVE
jgi:Fic family protein